MMLVGAGGYGILPRFAAGLLRHVKDDLVLITHVDGSQMWILLPPLRQMRLVSVITLKEVLVAKMDQQAAIPVGNDGANILWVRQIDLAQFRGHMLAGRVEIMDGLAEGDRVVVSANFLIDAESNLKAALNGLDTGEKPQ